MGLLRAARLPLAALAALLGMGLGQCVAAAGPPLAADSAATALARPAPPSAGRAVIDDDQHTLQLLVARPRIVSLAPGATAMLFAAGAGAQIVGTSDYSNEPDAARRIERVGDSQSFDLERILALHPDVVVIWSGGTGAAQIHKLERGGLPVYGHRIERLADIPASVRRLGVLAGTQAEADAAAARLGERIAALQRRYAAVHGGTVLIQVWDHPIYTVGRSELMSDVVRTCGYRNLYQDLPDPGPAVSLESVLERNPDVILAVGSDLAAADAWVASWRRYRTLTAVRSGRVIPWTDPRLSRLGPSMVDATEALCNALTR
ncbi:MAG TPA: cobalamin-binding protein [Steroidobacteraceae bacterium]